MGDRALIQLKSGTDVSTVLYLHWGGFGVKPIIDAARERMKSRHDDLSYAFARLVQIAAGNDSGATGFGVWNADAVLTAEDSHGDAGCFVIDASTPEWKVDTFGGYGFDHGVDEA